MALTSSCAHIYDQRDFRNIKTAKSNAGFATGSVKLGVYIMQSLGSPLHSPRLGHCEDIHTQKLPENLDPDAWLCSFQHVSLPEIEIEKPPPPHSGKVGSSANDWTFPQDDASLPSRGSPRSMTLSLTINEDGRASLENTLTSSNYSDMTEFHPQKEIRHTSHANSEWNLSSNCLGMSSSPRRLNSFEDLTQVSPSAAAVNALSSSPPHETYPIKTQLGSPIGSFRELKKRKRHSTNSGTKARVKPKCIPSSEIGSDPSHELMHLEDDEYAEIRSRAQVEKIMFRGILRAREAFEKVSAARGLSEDRYEQNGLQPIFREPESRPWNGKSSRFEAIKELSNSTGSSKSLRGFLRCSKNCDSSFETYEELAHHIDNTHGASARPYECPKTTCPWSIIGFSHFSECARHIASSHSERRFVCELCELENKVKSFTRTDALRRHISRTHHTNSVKRMKKSLEQAPKYQF